jgi:hypothetical protein
MKNTSIQPEPPESPSLEAGALAHGSRRALCDWLTGNGRVIGLVKKFQSPYAIGRFITVVGIARHCIVIQSTSSIFKAHFNNRVEVLFHLYQSFQIFLYIQVFQLEVIISPLRVTCQFYPPCSSISKFILCRRECYEYPYHKIFPAFLWLFHLISKHSPQYLSSNTACVLFLGCKDKF